MTNGIKPYSSEIHGDLIDYLNRPFVDNLFFSSKPFFVLKRMGLFIPEISSIRVDKSPIPDLSYFLNRDFNLESLGEGDYNMSMIGAKKGIYSPREILKNKFWSAFMLNPEKLRKT